MIISKPERQPDYVDNEYAFWFEEMMCIDKFTLYIYPIKIDGQIDCWILIDCGYKYISIGYKVNNAYKKWLKNKVDNLLLGVET